MPEGQRDPHFSSAARDAVLAAIIGQVSMKPRDERGCGPVRLAVGLRAHLDGAATLTPGERLLLAELLDRIADGGSLPAPTGR